MLRLICDIEEARRTVLDRSRGADRVPVQVREGIERVFGQSLSPEAAVAEILADVAARGDDALRDWTHRIDGISLDRFAVTRAELARALHDIASDLGDALTLAASRIREFHRRQPAGSWTTDALGGLLGQRVSPIERVGIYVPGGTAPLPSSLLMAAIPAQEAGVRELVVCTPPGRPDGTIAPAILAAAEMLGIGRVFRIGGAQAIAAMTFGTDSIPRVDKIVGPGNLFVTLAKKQVFGQVGLDGLAGPTETVVIADETANPEWVAADLLAQAEHDVMATAILLTPSLEVAERVGEAIARQVTGLARGSTVQLALANRGAAIVTPDLDTALELANEYAPEHLCLSLHRAEEWVAKVRNAGGVFVGEGSFEVLGDYVAGPSHIMPTGGTARFASPLNVWDFLKITSIIQLDDGSTKDLSRTAARIAESERLDAHAAAARLRSER